MPLEFVGHTQAIYSLAINTNKSLLASGDYSGSVMLWNTGTGKSLHILQEPLNNYNFATRLTFSPDGKFLVSGWDDKELGIRIWPVDTWEELHRIDSLFVADIAWHSEGKYFVCSGDGITIHDSLNGKILAKRPGHHYGTSSVAVSPNGKRIAAGSTDEESAIRIWDVDSEELVTMTNGYGSTIEVVRFNSDNEILWSEGYGTLYRWKIQENQKEIVFAKTGGIDNETATRLWNEGPEGQQKLRDLSWRDSSGYSVTISFDGKYFAYVIEKSERRREIDTSKPNYYELLLEKRLGDEIHVVNIMTKEKRNILNGQVADISVLAFDNTGHYLASGGLDDRLLLWNLGKEGLIT